MAAGVMLTGPAHSEELRWQEIHAAAENADVEKIKLLLKDNPQLVNAKDENGLTPLHLVAGTGVGDWPGQKETAQLLIAGGADVNARSNEGITPLHWASGLGKKAIVEQLLAQKGVEINAADMDGSTPLHWACAWGFDEIAGLLGNKGADVGAKDKDGLTPLQIATKKGHKITKILP